MLKDVVSWDIRITTGNSGSKTYRDLCMRECHRRSFSLCLSTGTLRRALSLSTKDSKRMANKRVQATLYSAADPWHSASYGLDGTYPIGYTSDIQRRYSHGDEN